MSTLVITLLAAAPVTPSVPDTGASSLLFGLGLLSLGVVARWMKKRKR